MTEESHFAALDNLSKKELHLNMIFQCAFYYKHQNRLVSSKIKQHIDELNRCLFRRYKNKSSKYRYKNCKYLKVQNSIQ
jgi:hypothetical protein